MEFKTHTALTLSSEVEVAKGKKWEFIGEGKNNCVYYDENDPALVWRIRKVNNKKFYTNPFLIKEKEYNHMFVE